MQEKGKSESQEKGSKRQAEGRIRAGSEPGISSPGGNRQEGGRTQNPNQVGALWGVYPIAAC